jgi:hypothetical protein
MYRIQKDNTNTNTNSTSAPYGKSSGVDQLKEQLVNYIYKVIDISRFKFELLQYENELHQLTERKYFLSVNFSGSNCLLIFTKIKDTFYACLIDRKTLSYNRQKVNINDVITFPINLKLDKDIYNGTIFDGIFIQGKTRTFVITDVYFFKGQDFTLSKLDSKLLTIKSYLHSNYNENDKNNNLVLTVNKLFPLDEIENVVKKEIPTMKNFFVRGIAFYPEKSGTKLIYLFSNEAKSTESNGQNIIQHVKNNNNSYNNNNNSSNNNSYNNNNSSNNNSYNGAQPNEKPESGMADIHAQQIQNLKKQVSTFYCPKDKKDVEYVFQMKQTPNPDVYFLNIVDPTKKDGEMLLKSIKIGNALIPDKAKSKWCRESMEGTGGRILVHCQFHPDKMKWEPLLLSTAKRPSYVEDFDVIEKDMF